MVFSSLIFLCIFLPMVLVLYFICPAKWKNLLLAAVSLIFYAWGEPRYILIMIFTILFDYTGARLIAYFQERRRKDRMRQVLIVSIVANLAVLCFFKYTDMLISTWNQLTASNIGLLGMALPIGISFYTFQTMSYIIDVYTGQVRVQKNVITFAMYVSMFPQLIAGPIVRYQQIEQQAKHRFVSMEQWVQGMQRFIFGLGKKVIFANQAGVLWDEIANTQMSQLSTLGAWLGAIAFTFQIYFDFSGYSDMAIGLGKMFGFRFPENFRYPYESKSITEFWRRWHITLSSWFREYVYIPLGGNRKGAARQILNLFIVWLLTGIWHGAGWNFVIWGMYFFVLLALEKRILLQKLERLPKLIQHLYSKFFIVLGWVLFANEDFSVMGNFLKTMFGMGEKLINSEAGYQLQNYLCFFIVLALASTGVWKRLQHKVQRYMIREEREYMREKGKETGFFFSAIAAVVVLVLSLSLIVSGSYNPFLYFRF